MRYNLGSSFKDILKIISLGALVSINGMSHDVFAMDDEDDEFLRVALAISAADAEKRKPKSVPPARETTAEKVSDRPRQTGAACYPYVFNWDQANPQQRDLLFNFWDSLLGVRGVKSSLKEIVDAWSMLEGSSNALETASLCGYVQEVCVAKQRISEIVKTFEGDLIQYYRENKASIGDERGDVIALLVKRFSNELKAIFDPVNALFGSEEALLGVLSSRDHLVGCGTAFREAQNRLEASFIGATKSEALRALLYVEYGTQPTEGQKRDIEGLASQKKAEMKRVQEEREEAENRRRIADFDERFDSFFNELQAHFEEKMARLIQNPGGQEEGVMPLSATDSLDFLRKALEQKGILEQVRSSFYNNIPDDQISLTFLRESRFDDLVRKMDQKRTAAFEGGLATIERHCFRSDRFPLSPKDAFLKPLAFLVALYERFPNDERVKTVVGEAFGLIEDQKGKCGAGLLGRSFMLSRSLLQLLRSGVEKPFEQ